MAAMGLICASLLFRTDSRMCLIYLTKICDVYVSLFTNAYYAILVDLFSIFREFFI